jgi:hypothetical protein
MVPISEHPSSIWWWWPLHQVLEHQHRRRCWNFLGIHWDHSLYFFNTIIRTKQECTHPFFIEIFSIAAWEIWKQRNNKIFRNMPLGLCWSMRYRLNEVNRSIFRPLGLLYIQFFRVFFHPLSSCFPFFQFINIFNTRVGDSHTVHSLKKQE